MNNVIIINVKVEGLSATCAILCEGRLHDSLELRWDATGVTSFGKELSFKTLMEIHVCYNCSHP